MGATFLTSLLLLIVVSLSLSAAYFSVQISTGFLVACFCALLPFPLFLFGLIKKGALKHLANEGIATDAETLMQAGDVEVVLLDKDDIVESAEVYDLIPAVHFSRDELAKGAYSASFNDLSIEGRAIVDYVKKSYPGVETGAHIYKKGPQAAMEKLTKDTLPHDLESAAAMIRRQGNKALMIIRDQRALGIVALRESIKKDITPLIARLQECGIRPILIASEGKSAAASAAKQIGIEDFLAEVTQEKKQELLENLHKQGYTAEIIGKEASSLGPLSSAYALIASGKQIFLSRGALYVFTIASMAIRSLAVFPPLLAAYFPFLLSLDLLHLYTVQTALTSVLIYDALSLFVLAPLLWRGCRFPMAPVRMSLFLYGALGILLPWALIKGVAILLR